MAACGGSTTSGTSTGKDGGNGGEMTTSTGGASTGGDTSSGGRITTGTGGAGNTGAGGSGAGGRLGSGGSTSGGAGASGGALGKGGAAGGAAGASHNCSGAMPRMGVTLCRTATDCVGTSTMGPGPSMCVMTEPYRGCGNPAFVPHQCKMDTDCPGTGSICQAGSCGATSCVEACSPSTCVAPNACVANKCVPKACDQPGGAVCGKGFVCKPGDANAGPDGCAVAHCDSANPCLDGFDCTTTGPGNGCVQRACMVDPDCSCGYCVNNRCEPTLGFCYTFIATPYGCVWPDEELV